MQKDTEFLSQLFYLLLLTLAVSLKEFQYLRNAELPYALFLGGGVCSPHFECYFQGCPLIKWLLNSKMFRPVCF